MDQQRMHTYDLFISYANADRAWVVGYLLDALRGAGVDYHSEAAFALGVPRVLEFDRAVQESARTLLVLSPAYVAEGFTQFTDLLAQSYGLETATWPVIPLMLHPVELPPRLTMLTALDATDQDDWEAVVERLCAELERPVPGPAPKPPCPYPGMVPFSEADSERFFGRDEETQELLERLRLHPFLTVIGPSGSGKSSLVFAGLVPALRKSGLFGPGQWLVRSMRPGEAPLDTLSDALDGDPVHLERAVGDLLASEGDAQRLLLIVDQFEEVFGHHVVESVAFQEALLRLLLVPKCTMVLTVRADFYPDLMASPLWCAIQAHRFEVLPLDDDGLREAIVRPAEDVAVFVETALVERLVADAADEPGVLPLVQETLVLLWEKVERRFLPLRAYEALVLPRRAYGAPPLTGLQVAMARRADAALAALMPEQQAIARRIFLRLVQFGEGRADTRRQQLVAALRSAADDPDQFDTTLHHLADHRLLTLSGDEQGAGRRVDIAHEALIGGWPTLQAWLNERREAELTRRRLEAKAAEWGRLGRGTGGLLDEVELLEAERWLASPDATDLGYGEALPALIEASRAWLVEEAAQERRMARFRLGALGAITVLVIVVLGIGLWSARRDAAQGRQLAQQRQEAAATAEAYAMEQQNLAEAEATARAKADAERDRADQQAQIALARQLAAQAYHLVGQQLDLALLLGVEAIRVVEALEGRSADAIEVPASEIRGSLLVGLESSPHLTTYLRRPGSSVRSVAFSPDGQTLASSGTHGAVVLWDVATRQPFGRPLTGHAHSVESVAFSPDGRTLASGSCASGTAASCERGEVRLWDIVTRQPLGDPLIGHASGVQSVAFSPDGKTLASGSNDRTIILWDVATHQKLNAPLTGHGGYVKSVAFSPDGQTLASGSLDHTLILWDVATGERLSDPLAGHADGVWSVAFSPDGQTLASGDSQGAIILWDTAARQRLGLSLTGHTGAALSVAFSPDGQTLASASRDHTIILWDVARRQQIGQPLTGHTGDAFSVAFNPEDGQTLASGGADANVILWDLAENQPLGQSLIGHGGPVSSVAFSPDSRLLASGGEDSTIILWDVGEQRQTGDPLAGHTGDVLSVAFSSDGQTLASGDSSGAVMLWDTAARRQLEPPLTGHDGAVVDVTFSPDGRTLVSGGEDGAIVLWDVAKRRQIGELHTIRGGPVSSVAFRPDGRVLASSAGGGTIALWDMTTDQPTGSLLTNQAGAVSNVDFSPDGRLLASVSRGGIVLWDIGGRQPSGQPLGSLEHMLASSLAFSSDGRTLASGCLHKAGSIRPTVILWDIAAKQPVGQRLTGHTDSIRTLAFSPDGKMLASGSEDSTVILWDVSSEAWRARACEMIARNLTWSEWEKYLPGQPYHATCPDIPVAPEAALGQADWYALAGEAEEASVAFAHAVQLTLETDSAHLSNSVCWLGSLDGFAETVLPACERAVELEPGHGGYRDSRGLARALTGDYAGAIADFRFYVDWGEGRRPRDVLDARLAWIQALEAGRNPFGAATLEALRYE